MKHNIGYVIRKIRESKDLSQENVAADLNLTTSAYSKIERGVTDPSAGRLYQIAAILEVDITEFFRGTRSSAREDAHTDKYGFVSKEDFEDLKQTVRSLKLEINRLRSELPAFGKNQSRNKKKK